MKIGLSVSKCVLDIVEGEIDYEDVLVIVGHTDFDPTVDEEWQSIWMYYSNPEISYGNPVWSDWKDVTGAEDRFRAITLQLWHDGKIHQPRKFGAVARLGNHHWLDVILPIKDLENNPAAKSAWEKFQTVAGLSNIKIGKAR